MKEVEEKINRFIDALARRKDATLNKFFSEVLTELEPLFQQEDTAKAEILEFENARLKMMLSLFTNREYHEYDYTVLEVLKKYSTQENSLYNTHSFHIDADVVWMIQVVCKLKGTNPIYPKDRKDLDAYLNKIIE